MNKFYFNVEAEELTMRAGKDRVKVQTYKSAIDFLNSYHYYRGLGKTVEESLALAK